MRTRHSLPFALLFLLSTLLLPTTSALADDTYDDEYEERARVVRVSLLKGEVSLRRSGNVEWERAKLNAPLVEGDRLATGRDSRLEIQIDSRNFVRVGADSVLTVVTLRDEGIALSLAEGTATLKLSRFDRDKEYFEIDAPKTTVAAEKTGQYRIDVASDGGVRVTVREDGRARVYSQNSGFDLRNNRSARLVYGGAGEGDWELSSAGEYDEWDYWNDERELYLAKRLKYEGRERYYDSEVYGAEELDLYGDWVHTSDYGYVWRPHTTVINNYYNWSPYRYGHWSWCPPYGWTWIADEPWGWAPYHYGRWVYYNNNWCWAPRGYGYNYRRARWRPALVVFVNLSFGHDRHVAWYPLGHGQRDPRGRWWDRRYDPLTPLRSGHVDNLRRANPALLRAVTSIRARDFGAQNVRARPATNDLAQRAISTEPMRGPLPVTPSDGARAGSPRVGTRGEGRVLAPGSRTTDASGREALSINRPAPVTPPRIIPNRETGATTRTPGVPLDGELRRTHVFKNREPRVSSSTPSAGGGGTPSSDDNTGAVTRPNRSGRPTIDSGGVGGSGNNAPRVRPARPSTPTDARPSEPINGVEPRVRRSEPDARNDDSDTPRVRPTRPNVERPNVERPSEDRPREERPRVERPSPPAVYKTEPGERPSTPTRREESQPSRPERSAPPPRNDPPPRQEAPRQETPRQEAPRQEAPRSAPREERPASPPKEESRPARVKPDDQR
ncbi:MAG TPA: DUF6600 domain-containing protein [Pyrinomonadaceae bacterium]|nr:DUF6600 domain-containing protein [Pyrinomonadaceae bacterium]